MNNRCKQGLAVLLCLCLLAMGTLAAPQTTISAAPSVMLHIVGIDDTVFSQTLPLRADETVWTLLLFVLQAEGIDYVAEDGYVSAIAGEAAGTFGGYDGWVYYINGVEASVGMGDAVLQAGDLITVCYADPFGAPPTLYPTVTATRMDDGLISLHVGATQTSYLADGTMEQTQVDIVDATVTVEGTAYQTGADGTVQLSAAHSAMARVSVQVDKRGADNKPLLVAMPPDFWVEFNSLSIPGTFTDVSAESWFYEPVTQLAETGIISGYPDGSFRPMRGITRAEFVALLANMAEASLDAPAASFADVAVDSWYAEEVAWAAQLGIAQGYDGRFSPEATLSRQDLAVMLVRFVEAMEDFALREDAAAPTFSDAGDIAPYAAEAVYLLQKAGIVSGSNGAFSPTQEATRAEVSKMLWALVG